LSSQGRSTSSLDYDIIKRFPLIYNLCECEVPIKVIGDIHAQYQDMNRLFDLIGRVPQERFLFLGDYVDRGPQGVEVVILLFSLKLRYRDRIYLLRGNHETPAVNKIYGFYNECVMKYGAGIWWDFQACFNRIPLAGLISKKVLCMHGGLSPELSHLDVIRNIPRPCEPLDRGLLIDLTWADPTNKGDGWFHSIRGISYMFGKGVVQQACQMLGIELIIRAHQVVQDGYEMMAGRRLITVFSAPNYCGQFTNAAAIVCLDEDLEISFQQLKMQIPANLAPKARPCPIIASDPNAAAAKADKETIKPFTVS
uniref:Serine/threonine-protein phosphatase n=1 Tax=Haemonchus placei TaxID=6290 RepID=A0A0N4WDN8_HAEPC